MKKFFLIIIAGGILPLSAQFEGAFINHDGGVTAGLDINYQTYDKLQTKDTSFNGNLLRKMDDFTFRLHASYSPIEKLAIYVSVPLKIVTSNEGFTGNATQFTDTLPSSSMFGIGNVAAGVKYKFFHKKGWALATSFLAEFKTSNTEDKTGLRTGPECFSFNPNFHVAKVFSEKYYINLDLGGTYRTDNYSGDFRVYTEVGATFWKEQIWVRLGFDVRQSFKNGNFFLDNNRQTGLFLNNREYLGIVFRAEYCHPVGVGLFAGVNGYFAGNNIPEFPLIQGGVFYRMKYDLKEKLPYTIEPINK